MDLYTHESLPEIHVIGIEQRLSLNDQDASKKIGEFWQQFFTKNVVATIPHKVDDKLYALYTDYTPHGDYSQILGVAVSSLEDIPQGMVGKTIARQPYAVFKAHGPFVPSIGIAWQTIWQTPLNRSFTSDFEIFDSKSTNDQHSVVSIYVALKE